MSSSITSVLRLAAVASAVVLGACRTDLSDAATTADSAAASGAQVSAASPETAPQTPTVAADAPAASSRTPAAAPSAASPPAATSRAPEGPQSVPTKRVTLYGVDLTGVGYDKGRPDAPITIVEFSDFGCPFCGSHARQTMPSLEREFIATGKVFYKYVPFVMGMFPNGQQAARTAECAAEQGQFWPMHDKLYAVQNDWKRSLSPFDLLQGYAAELGLDRERFRACYTKYEFHPRTRTTNERADQLGIRATPTIFVNDRAIEGALPLPQFRQLLTEMSGGRR